MRNATRTAAALTAMVPICVLADDRNLPGTYRLVSSTRTILETGEVRDSYGKDPKGYIMYGADGRMLVLITYGDRPKPPPTDRMTETDRAEQYSTMNAYGGTYTYHGDRIEHHIDISFNERNVGNVVIRDIRREGDRLVYTTKPQPFSGDGRVSVVTLVWEKVK